MKGSNSLQIFEREIKTHQMLEESLWRAETRFNTAYLDRLLAVDFLEFGRSGKIYSRAEVLETPCMSVKCNLPLKNFTAHPLSEDAVLVTYISEGMYDEWEYANRSSLWISSLAGWQVRFHQGTLFTPVD